MSQYLVVHPPIIQDQPFLCVKRFESQHDEESQSRPNAHPKSIMHMLDEQTQEKICHYLAQQTYCE